MGAPIILDSLNYGRYHDGVRVEFDKKKSEKNAQERGLPFDLVTECDWETVKYLESRRVRDETRFNAYVMRNGRLHHVVFTHRGDALRVISFRKANKRERKKYEEIN